MSGEDIILSKPTSEVDSIRNLLFGDQVAQFDERFNTLDRAIASLRTENRNLRQALEAELTIREQSHRDLQSLVATLDERVTEKFREERRYHDIEVSRQIEMINAVMQVLEGYRNHLEKSAKEG